MQYFFDKYPEFIERDVRRNRNVSPISIGTLSNRHEAALPKSLIEGKTILDLGACIGATGAWCLANGAKYYEGIEVQQSAVDTGNELLGAHWHYSKYFMRALDIIDALDEAIEDEIQYDIVVAFGIVYGYADYYGFLNKVSQVAKEAIVIDCKYPPMRFIGESVIEIKNDQHFHIDGEDSLNYTGIGSLISPVALQNIMRSLGWDNDNKLIYPEAANEDTIDMYLTLMDRDGIDLPTRYLTRFNKANDVLNDVSTNVATQNKASLVNDERVPTRSEAQHTMDEQGTWEFDASVATRFKQEAENHIPDYYKVIDLAYETVHNALPDSSANIIDVGSALGYTVDYFVNKGYENTYGVEKSQFMIDHSAQQEHITHSDTLPTDHVWDAVIANWTLHFIDGREDYLQNIFDNMSQGGVLVLTDKMQAPPEVTEQYYDFKRSNGVDEEEIEAKRKALINVLVPMPLAWYLSKLRQIGFRNIEVINARYMFYTIVAYKPR